MVAHNSASVAELFSISQGCSKSTCCSRLVIAACARQQLAPLALDAYPEAYTEFKTALTLLLYVNSSPQITSSNQDSPGADSPHGQPPIPAALKHLLDISTREELAEVVYHTIRQLTSEWHVVFDKPLSLTAHMGKWAKNSPSDSQGWVTHWRLWMELIDLHG